MCGIAGIVDLAATRPIDAALLDRMTDALTHRGPDERGVHVAPGIGFGHRRLSIIDLASGQQPMASDDRKVWLTFNGEIYNFLELRAELETLGHHFHTRSDTEVLLHAWMEWGESCVSHLRGMFAFAVWDGRSETFFLARDRLGIKPVYYALLPDGRLLFASELKSIVLCSEVRRALDPQAIEEYFAFGYVPEPRTIFSDVCKLSPGHTLSMRRGQSRPTSTEYWDVPFALDSTISEADARAELIARTREAVQVRLVAEVPLGAFLSGGVDSSAVVAMMAGLQSDPVNTCSISFASKQFDESAYAATVAERYRTNHRVRDVNPDDFDLIGQLIDLYDEPYADSSALPTYRVCQLARENVTVALSGDGGDENYAGYRRYRLHMAEEVVRQRIPRGLRQGVFGPLGRFYPKLDWAPRFVRGKTTFQSLARTSIEAYLHSVSIFSDELRRKLFSEHFEYELQGYRAIEVFEHHAARAPTDDPLSLVQYLDMKTYLVGDILTKVDRASMAHALEVRVPLLDHPLVEWISSLPSTMKLRGGDGKHIFKQALKPYLSDDILYRQKMGFAVPLAEWFRGPLRQRVADAVLGDRLRDSGYFDAVFLQHAVSAHQSGRRDYSPLLWSLLMFDAFLQRLER